MTADCGIRGDAKKEMQSCWTYVKCQSRPAKSCKARRYGEGQRLAIYIYFTQFYRLFTGPGFQKCFSKRGSPFSVLPGLRTDSASVARKAESLEAFFRLTAVTLRLEATVRKLGKDLHRADLSRCALGDESGRGSVYFSA